MSTQKMSTTASDLPPQPPTIIELLDRIKKIVNKTVPDGKLENRLLNLGLEEFIKHPTKDDEKTLIKYGFPFKFNGQLDEAILVMANFLDRLRDEGGDLKIYLLNNFSNGDNMDLFYWQSAKAKLYLELQNLILQLNGLSWTEKKKKGRTKGSTLKCTSRIVRVFTFRNLVDIAYLNQPAISAMIEQLATGTQIGFMFSDTFKHKGARRALGKQIPNSIVVVFRPARKKRIHDVFLFQDQTERSDLPYQERCKAKWFPDLKKARQQEKDLNGLLALFNSENWSQFGKDPSKVCQFEHRGSELFNKAAVMLYEAFRNSDIANDMRDQGEDPDEFIVDKINREVISDEFMEIQRTMSIFDEAEDICAVDATSTKKSLKVHETSPTYRQWIRKSLNRVLNPKSVLKPKGKSLNRIYILKDTHDEKEIEFGALVRILQYYFDYYHYDISEMDNVVRVKPNGQPPAAKETPEWLKEDYWPKLRDRIHIHITTSNTLKKVTDHFDQHALAKLLSDVFAPSTVSTDDIHSYLVRLDYLFTGNLIYNYRNPRATPTEARDEAFLYRSAGSFNLAEESNRLFKFGDNLTKFTELQTRSRMRSLLKVLEKYGDRHYATCEGFKEFIDSDARTLRVKDIKEKIEDSKPIDLGDPQHLLDIRLNYESLLYSHYREKFVFLHRLLEAFSVEVKFFDAPDKEKIQDVYPFEKPTSVAMLNRRIQTEITKRKDQITQLNEDLKELLKVKERNVAKGSIFINYARLDERKVFQIYDKLKDSDFAPWMDQRDILPGQNWDLEIARAIETSNFFLACISKNSADRRGYVQRELKDALDKWKGMLVDDIYLIPARLDDGDVPATLSKQFQSVDLFKNGDLDPEGWERLLASLNLGLKAREPK